MTLNENSEVEEASNEETFIPEAKFKFLTLKSWVLMSMGRSL